MCNCQSFKGFYLWIVGQFSWPTINHFCDKIARGTFIITCTIFDFLWKWWRNQRIVCHPRPSQVSSRLSHTRTFGETLVLLSAVKSKKNPNPRSRWQRSCVHHALERCQVGCGSGKRIGETLNFGDDDFCGARSWKTPDSFFCRRTRLWKKKSRWRRIEPRSDCWVLVCRPKMWSASPTHVSKDPNWFARTNFVRFTWASWLHFLLVSNSHLSCGKRVDFAFIKCEN